MKEKSQGKELSEKLFYKKKTAFEKYSKDELCSAMAYAEEYKGFINAAKTEREAVVCAKAMLEKNGYRPYTLGQKVKAGDKFYYDNRSKGFFAFSIGSADIETDGIRICAAHIDSPRLDLKQHPLYEDNSFAYFKTHYYGGIRKYQWTALLLALHGVITTASGDKITVSVGEDEGDAGFCITDLLPHLAQEQSKKTLAQAFSGEGLNIVIGSSPFVEDDGKVTDADEKVKLNILNILNEKYSITEEDFVSAELCAVPAGKARDIGFDRWLLGAYGNDDRVCAYPALTALIETADTAHTVICMLADKEETGSDGNTGTKSSLLCDIIREISASLGADEIRVRASSKCLSADVNAGFDPNYPDVYEKRNSAIIGCGVCMSKFTGSRGKYDTSDASSEYVGYIRRLFERSDVLWQTAELGRVDLGGGGTVAKYIANHNIDTVDLGVPVLSMHSPFEIISKADLWSAHTAFCAFLGDENNG